ncbi:pseudouridine synthase [Helicobacter enhydrae]|uniref:RNA pseudouridylate synthase n=1 Tax=Helicobacter enhydrae TaxID=222136 RepID=A0A1B1U6H9_9HELI|nr:pseudouridine synthase [Helicobacter enhydrae]ANV98369.1 pseudouridine synthase [Helicobacter enhydrae]
MRINKYISHNTKHSRKEADGLVLAGRVNIDKQKAMPTSIVQEGQRVFIDGKPIKPKEQFTAIIYHKPKGELVSKKDDRGRKTIYQSLSSQFGHFLPVGRLDFASEGLLILCDQPKVVDALMRCNLTRTYLLKLNGSITQAMQESMQNGLKLENATLGGHTKSTITSMEFAPFEHFSIIKNARNYSKIKVSITEGKNRELRRFFAHFGREVLDLKRVSYGFVNLNALPSGKTRFFNKEEYKALHQFLKTSQKEL